MAIKTTHNEVEFGVGDTIRVHQIVQEKGKKDKTRTQIIEGIVIKIKGRDVGKSFTIRRVGSQKVGMEFIIPLSSPTLKKIEVAKKGTSGVKRAKLYYIRNKSKKEIDKIYSRTKKK